MLQAGFRFLGALVVMALVGFGCGGDDKKKGSGLPDTGYGTDQTVPSEKTCSEMCARLADCVCHLCAEDKKTDMYLDMVDFFVAQCKATCNASTLSSQMPSDKWSCLFESSCREAFDDDVCDANAYYYCD
jgi:hypothetical protein